MQAWAHELQHTDGLKLPTIRRIVSAARGYWEYLQRLDIVPDDVDPFYKAVPMTKKGTKATLADKRREFSPSEVVSLLSAAVERDDRDLGLLIWLGMWTGCRIEELCALRVSEVTEDRFVIIDAKSEAGLREVPIHSMLKPAIRHMCSTSKDGYVMSGLTNNKYDDRSNANGKRFGRLKTALGFDRTYVYHSLRKTVATQLDAAGIPEIISARILGHDLKTMTYGLYSGGAPFETKRDALEALSYPLAGDSHERLWEGRGEA
ncbi:tyrosine-type recombinase/integrase [Maritimibacter alkaliphilus]|uniref:tyrosine-type recombinase/integrase n=1 Tax=Maritimibacter alkaliphilus TaxID=404236 RepID=UPI001C96BD5A|nr:tyrosine-type recombinase/integrase [Maritimibacter alkaliphilus]MBY6092374.1 tyrosine-type recombinase/integrase [Maritimibacter alkaliphilus]